MASITDLVATELGSWQLLPQTAASGASFDIQSVAGETLPVWQVNLPADPASAANALQADAARLETSWQALDAVPDRIDRLVKQAQASGGGGISFDASLVASLPQAESEALGLLQSLNAPAAGMSFGLGDEEKDKLQEAFQQFEADMAQLWRLISHYAWVETQVDGVCCGRTVVDWNGDLDTNWKSGLRAEIYPIHQRALQQALASRNLILHAVLITTQSAAKLGVLIAAPGGAILAIPVAWKYVNQILADIQKFKEITKAIQ